MRLQPGARTLSDIVNSLVALPPSSCRSDFRRGIVAGAEILIIVLRTWFAIVLGFVTASPLLGGHDLIAALMGITVVAVLWPYGAVRGAHAEFSGVADRDGFRRGLLLVLGGTIGALWLAMLPFLVVSLGTMATAANVPMALVVALLAAAAGATLISFGVVVAGNRVRRRASSAY